MQIRTAILAIVVVVLGACATPRQAPIQLAPETIAPQSGRLGVAMTKLPSVDTHLPGTGCLLCMAAAAATNSSLTDYSKTLSYEDLPQLKTEVGQVLAKKGTNVV